jgi:hypothetical protein
MHLLHSLISTLAGVLILLIALTGCASTLVKDGVKQDTDDTLSCHGSDWISDSSVAVVPVPIVAFFVPHADTNDIRADEYLRSCGASEQLINRNVNVNRAACLPASLTRILTLGIWQWCPARVSWSADVRQAHNQ